MSYSASGRSRTTNFPICRNPPPANGTAPCIGCWSRFHIRQSRDHRRHGPVGPWTDRLETYRTDGGRASCRTRPPAEAVRRIFQFVEIRNRSTELHLASAAGRGCTSGSRVTIDTTGQLALGPTGWKPIVRPAAEPLVVLGLRPKPYDEFSNLSKSATGQRNCTLHRLLVAVAHQAVA